MCRLTENWAQCYKLGEQQQEGEDETKSVILDKIYYCVFYLINRVYNCDRVN